MKKMEKSKIIGVGLSLLLMGTVAFGSLNLDNTAFADKESNVKSSIEKDKKDQQDKTVVFSLNKKGEIIINTNASIKQIVDELVRINKESKFDLDLEKLIKYKDELLNSKGLTPSKLADLMEDVFDEIEDVVEDIEDEIEDLKDNNFSEQTKKQFVKEKEKLKEEYNEKRQVLRKKLKQDIKEGKDPEKVKKEFEENINKLENSQTQAIKELKDKFLAQSKKENELKNKDGKKDRKDKENNEEDDDDDDDDEDDDD